MNEIKTKDRLRFIGPHRCPRCRMPLRAEELSCPCCELQIVFRADSGELMIEMVAIDNPGNSDDSKVREYLEVLRLERAGDMCLPSPLPTRARRALIVTLKDGTRGIAYSNMVTLDDLAKRPD